MVFSFLDRIPAEISFDWVYFPPFLWTVLLGFICAFGMMKLLNASGLIQFFWYPGLVFMAFWVLMTSVIGLTFVPP